ncbi:MAG TPA: DUF2889 domain-containing protein [Acidimicrobiia bacterium]|nr:DUF2889 domain-containing protein [Acidimicrobiia bacterium]
MALSSPTAPQAPLGGSVSGTPPRRTGSVRRTATVDMCWPGGIGTPLNLVGRSRDLVTVDTSDDPVVVGAAEMLVTVGAERTITSIETVPDRPGIDGLVGTQGGSYLRGAIDRVLPGEREAATPLHVLLDDVAGTSLIAGFAWSRWPEARVNLARAMGSNPGFGMRKGKVICSGLRPDGWAQTARQRGDEQPHDTRPAGDISTPDDPWGWHALPDRPPVCMRRHRRIDVYADDGHLHVDSFFRDSSWEPDGSELALHEYSVVAEVDATTLTLAAVSAQPHVLPFPECPWAAPHVTQLVGLPVTTFRTNVQETLRELECCTHLNDMLRCLAEVPALADALRRVQGG